MILFMGLAAINSQANLLFGVFGLMIGTLLVSGTISKVVLKKLQITRVLPEHGIVGRTMRVTYEIKNRKRFWPSLSISLAELDGVDGFVRQPQCYMLHAAPGMTASVPAEMIPKRRGLYELDRYQLGTSFPFGFIKRACDVHRKDTIEIFPALGEVDRKLLVLCRSAESSGAMMRPRPGGMDEFYGVKEYRTGDSPRWIYWRRTAHTGKLVSKEMTQVAPPRLLLLVDTFLNDRTLEQHVLLERTIAMAASLADTALADGLSVGLCVWSNTWMGIPPTRGKHHRRELLSVLARLPLNTQHPTAELMQESQDMVRNCTTPVLMTPHDVQLGLIDQVRGGMIVVSAVYPAADAWFRFDSQIDFATVMPPDQQPEGEGVEAAVRKRAEVDGESPDGKRQDPARREALRAVLRSEPQARAQEPELKIP